MMLTNFMLYIYASNRDFNRAFHRKIVERFDLSLGEKNCFKLYGYYLKIYAGFSSK